MEKEIKPRTLKIEGKNIYLLRHLLSMIVEKYNHGVVETVDNSNLVTFNFWANEREYEELIEAIESTSFDIKVIKTEEV